MSTAVGGLVLLATYSLMTTLGPDALAFPFKEVLWPLGMTRTAPETDWQGHYVMSSQVWMTARDSARLALLYANDGMFDGKQLLPKGWVGYVSSTRGAQPENPHTSRYGAGFWVLDARQGPPSGTFAMEGSRGQYAIIVPSANVIIVRRGFDPLDARFDIDRFTHDALGVLKGRAAGSKRAAARGLLRVCCSDLGLLHTSRRLHPVWLGDLNALIDRALCFS